MRGVCGNCYPPGPDVHVERLDPPRLQEGEFDPIIDFKPDGVIKAPDMLALRRAGLCFCGGKLDKFEVIIPLDPEWECQTCGALYRKERAE